MHRDPRAKNNTIFWARNVLSNKSNYVILDTETTGIKKTDVIVEISLIDLEGNDLFTSLIRPKKKKRIPSEASKIHNITMSMLKECPTFSEVVNYLNIIIGNKKVLIYNAEFDERILDQTSDQDECKYMNLNSECVMEQYSIFVGKYSEYHQDYTFQKLPKSNHTALGDCRATLRVIEKMANTNLEDVKQNNVESNKQPKAVHIINTEGKKWWEFWKF